MESLEACARVAGCFENDRFARQSGIVLDNLTEAEVTMHMELTADMGNLFGRPHGGAIYTLADAAFSVLANNGNNISVALDCTVTYHNGPEIGQTLYVRGRPLAVSKRVGSYLFDIYTIQDDREKRIATMKGTAFRTGRPIA